MLITALTNLDTSLVRSASELRMADDRLIKTLVVILALGLRHQPGRASEICSGRGATYWPAS
jgi:hypothetical protein